MLFILFIIFIIILLLLLLVFTKRRAGVRRGAPESDGRKGPGIRHG